MKTKFLVRMLNRSAHLEANIELADVVTIASSKGSLSALGSRHLFNDVAPNQHPRLAARENSSHNRRLAVRQMKANLCTAYMKEIYEDVTAYMQALLEAAARNGLDPNRLIGEHKVTLEANEILLAKNWPAVVHLVATSVFRELESKRSTKNLLQKMNSKLNLGVMQKTIDAALPYLELRHLLVHSDGVADAVFTRNFPAFGVTTGSKVVVDFRVHQAARKAISALVHEFDRKVVAKNIVAASDLQP